MAKNEQNLLATLALSDTRLLSMLKRLHVEFLPCDGLHF